MSNSKKVLSPYKVITGGSLAGNITSNPTNVQYLDSVSVQANITSGSASGVLKIQACNDYAPGIAPTDSAPMNGNWIDVPNLSLSISSSLPSNIMFNISEIGWNWIRASYLANTGSGTMDIIIAGRSF